MERYFTNTAHVDLTDRLCESTMRTVMLHAGRVLENKRDYDAWAEIMWAGTIAHCNLLGTGREQDWASHNIEHELSAQYDIAHGAGLAIIFPAWMKYVLSLIHIFKAISDDYDGVPVEYSRAHYRGDRNRFSVELRRT